MRMFDISNFAINKWWTHQIGYLSNKLTQFDNTFRLASDSSEIELLIFPQNLFHKLLTQMRQNRDSPKIAFIGSKSRFLTSVQTYLFQPTCSVPVTSWWDMWSIFSSKVAPCGLSKYAPEICFRVTGTINWFAINFRPKLTLTPIPGKHATERLLAELMQTPNQFPLGWNFAYINVYILLFTLLMLPRFLNSQLSHHITRWISSCLHFSQKWTYSLPCQNTPSMKKMEQKFI